jgi:hypothetical protein
MRILAAVVALVLFEPLAHAGPTGGGGGSSGGGRLGQVSSGLGRSGGGGGGGGARPTGTGSSRDHRDTTVIVAAAAPVVVYSGGVLVEGQPPPRSVRESEGTKVDLYAAAGKVHESDGMWTAELALRDGLFRLGGSVTRYYERQGDNSMLTLTVPSLIGGVRVDDHRATRVYLELGVTAAKTKNDALMDTSLTGALGGIRVEHPVSRGTTLIATAHEMVFENDVRAHAATVGVKLSVFQVSLRVLDFNVGPALYGPEVGLRF